MRRSQQFISVVLAAGLWMAAFCSPALAVGSELDTAGGVMSKLFRGIANTVTGWIEIPKQVSLTWQESGPGSGMTWGLLKGFGWAVARTGVGAYEVVTFPMPIPEGYRPIMQPTYVMSELETGRSTHDSK